MHSHTHTYTYYNDNILLWTLRMKLRGARWWDRPRLPSRAGYGAGGRVGQSPISKHVCVVSLAPLGWRGRSHQRIAVSVLHSQSPYLFYTQGTRPLLWDALFSLKNFTEKVWKKLKQTNTETPWWRRPVPRIVIHHLARSKVGRGLPPIIPT